MLDICLSPFLGFLDPFQLSPLDTNERALHSAARRAGLTFPCEITYLDLPICSGHDDYGAPILEVKQWPFLLPNDMVPCKYFQYLVVLFLVSEPYPTKGYNSFLNAGLYLSSCAHASGPGIGG